MNNSALPIWTISSNTQDKIIYEIQFYSDLLFQDEVGEPIRSDTHNHYFAILDNHLEAMPVDGVTGYRALDYDDARGVHVVKIGKEGAQVCLNFNELRNDFPDVFDEAKAYRVKANEGVEYGYLYLTV